MVAELRRKGQHHQAALYQVGWASWRCVGAMGGNGWGCNCASAHRVRSHSLRSGGPHHQAVLLQVDVVGRCLLVRAFGRQGSRREGIWGHGKLRIGLMADAKPPTLL